ncbi:DUF3995 domain-containing protein [Streptomyces sp. N2-109]|uniref:DUF3995 domain-containing protein n=1 Tax=Streptomyces gossypii TaxID=2883101 RepID=A0ABT2JNI1_9ACTN|nr:DUF3995 domain-containing protein [Streptomyces gossypii]MCT2589427.1 DUF3995 domain-containing protein [Streptomyces gossypii]
MNETTLRDAADHRRTMMTVTAGTATALWALVFAGFHVHWAVGGDLGLGDGKAATDSLTGAFLVYDLVVAAMCLAGAGVALELRRADGRSVVPRWVLLTAAWAATLLLLARGGIGVADDVLRSTGALTNGLSGMTTAQVYGEADPSAYTLWSMRAVDAYFVIGGVLFGTALRGRLRQRTTAPTLRTRAARPSTHTA